MSLTYSPTNATAYNSFWGPVFLASRDITGQVPMNKVEYAGVNVQAACSPDNVFDSDQYQRCLSNLLSAQFRWFTFDIYWDSTNHQFGLCPVQLPSQDANNTSTAAIGSSNSAAMTMVAATASTSSATASPAESDNGNLLQLGPYQCSNDLTFDSVLDLFHNYISATSSKALARVVLFELNLHAATLLSQPQGPAPTPSEDQMPTPSTRVGHLVSNDNLQPFLYPFSELLSDRSNLNATWYATEDPHRMQFTRETYLLFSKVSRLLVSWGTVDDQMAAYDFGSDSSTVFPRGYMSTQHAFQVDSTTGALSSGCFYDDTTTNPSCVNVNWSLGYTNNPSTALQPHLLGNLTACGISPILNTSLTGGTSAAFAFTPYLDFITASVLGWAPGEPQNSSSPHARLNGPSNQFRCAVLDSRPAYSGRWRVANCQQRFAAACRVDSDPYRWRLTPDAVTFHDAPDACRATADADTDTVFDQPRTGLENTYLYHHVLNQSAAAPAVAPAIVWINLNSLAHGGCWVTTGPNGTCDYADDLESMTDRQILIPTIGALLILFLTLLTILVKCNSNYRHNRRTKPGPGGWEYEGVPS
ncbi:hypothetical protein DV736_g2157, partial [Chaetothyriales sp. CBS 134916]